jgi:hypothetical protein
MVAGPAGTIDARKAKCAKRGRNAGRCRHNPGVGAQGNGICQITGMRRLNDGLLSAGALIVLVVALVSIDVRVRDQIAEWMRYITISGTGSQIGNVGSIVLEAALEQSAAHAPLVIFAVAAVVLVIFMLKTL